MKYLMILGLFTLSASCSHFHKNKILNNQDDLLTRDLSSNSPKDSRRIIKKIQKKIRAGALDELSSSEIAKLNRKLTKASNILSKKPDSRVACLPEDSSDYAIFVLPENRQIGYDIYGSSWCKASLETAKASIVVCAPEDSTDFAYFRVSDGKQIGNDIYGNSFCRKDFVNARNDVVCAPEDSTDYSIFRISDGKRIGYDIYGSSWCKTSIMSTRGDLICAPEDSTDFAVFKISTGKKVGRDYSNINDCLKSLQNIN